MKHNPGVGVTNQLRVSVATYNRVIFPNHQGGTLMLALERKATASKDGSVSIQAQPFGGGVHILNFTSLQKITGKLRFDSEQSKTERDFRILIPPSKWELVKEYCLHHLENPDDVEIESDPDRELFEEFEETLHVNLKADQYTVQPVGFVIEDNPSPTHNVAVQRQPTARLYRIFEVRIIDVALCKTMLDVSQRYSDQDLGILAIKDFKDGGRGWANSILTLPLDMITETYIALPPKARYRKIVVENHTIDESVLAILGNVEVPQYQKT